MRSSSSYGFRVSGVNRPHLPPPPGKNGSDRRYPMRINPLEDEEGFLKQKPMWIPRATLMNNENNQDGEEKKKRKKKKNGGGGAQAAAAAAQGGGGGGGVEIVAEKKEIIDNKKNQQDAKDQEKKGKKKTDGEAVAVGGVGVLEEKAGEEIPPTNENKDNNSNNNEINRDAVDGKKQQEKRKSDKNKKKGNSENIVEGVVAAAATLEEKGEADGENKKEAKNDNKKQQKRKKSEAELPKEKQDLEEEEGKKNAEKRKENDHENDGKKQQKKKKSEIAAAAAAAAAGGEDLGEKEKVDEAEKKNTETEEISTEKKEKPKPKPKKGKKPADVGDVGDDDDVQIVEGASSDTIRIFSKLTKGRTVLQTTTCICQRMSGVPPCVSCTKVWKASSYDCRFFGQRVLKPCKIVQPKKEKMEEDEEAAGAATSEGIENNNNNSKKSSNDIVFVDSFIPVGFLQPDISKSLEEGDPIPTRNDVILSLDPADFFPENEKMARRFDEKKKQQEREEKAAAAAWQKAEEEKKKLKKKKGGAAAAKKDVKDSAKKRRGSHEKEEGGEENGEEVTSPLAGAAAASPPLPPPRLKLDAKKRAILSTLHEQISAPLDSLIAMDLLLHEPRLIRPRILFERSYCDICSASFFFRFMVCSRCGMEVCARCFLEKEGDICHPKSEYFPVSFVHDKIKKKNNHENNDLGTILHFFSDAENASHCASPPPLNHNQVDHRELVVVDVADLKGFERKINSFIPVVVGNLMSSRSFDWSPDALTRNLNCDAVFVMDSSRETGHQVEVMCPIFFNGLKSISLRPPDVFNKLPMVLKIKDFPPNSTFAEVLPFFFQEFLDLLPFPTYSHPRGVNNIASFCPLECVPSDLGPKMYVSYGGTASPAIPLAGFTPLHLDVSDAVNIMVWIGSDDVVAKNQSKQKRKSGGGMEEGGEVAPAPPTTKYSPADDLNIRAFFLFNEERKQKRKAAAAGKNKKSMLDADGDEEMEEANHDENDNEGNNNQQQQHNANDGELLEEWLETSMAIHEWRCLKPPQRKKFASKLMEPTSSKKRKQKKRRIESEVKQEDDDEDHQHDDGDGGEQQQQKKEDLDRKQREEQLGIDWGEDVGAIWHLFSPQDRARVSEFVQATSKRINMVLENAVMDQKIYLDNGMLKELERTTGIRPWIVYQRLGDAVFVPAGSLHQVFNVRSCIKIAADFIAPQHVSECVNITSLRRSLSPNHAHREDKLQIGLTLYHANRFINQHLSHAQKVRIVAA